MTQKPRCSHLTTRGRPCRNFAAPGTEPPACARHRRITNGELRMANEEAPACGQPYLPGLERSWQLPLPDRRPPAAALHPLDTDLLTTDPLTTDHVYFPRPTAADQRVIAATAEEPDLRPEVELVRVVLRRLLAHLDETAGELPPEEVRRVAGLLFSGARTVALLLGKRPLNPVETEAWMVEALRLMGEAVGREL